MAQAGGTTRSDLAFLDGLDLSHQQRMFVVGYVELGNGAEAARRAGYSPRTARQQASDLLTKPNIKFAVARARKTIEASTMIRADDVARRWWGIANASPAGTATVKSDDGRRRTVHCLEANHLRVDAGGMQNRTLDTEDALALVSQIAVQVNVTIEGNGPHT